MGDRDCLGALVLGLSLALGGCSEPEPPAPDAAALEPSACVSSAPQLAREADFIALDELALGPMAPDAKVRMFYAFQPADSEPDCKPLMIFGQGGPVAGMLPLWAGNTGMFTLDPAHTGAAKISPNPNSWTRFANLLYVDSPYAGFSYVRDAGPLSFGGPFDGSNEAAAYIRALISFLDRHSALARVPVVLVGESYGGFRASVMMQELLHYESLRGTSGYHDPALADEIERYLRGALSTPSGPLSPAQIGAHFGQVLIQPYFHQSQLVEGGMMLTPLQQMLAGGADDRLNEMVTRVVDPTVFRELTGVVIEDMHAMYASARTTNFLWERRGRFISHDETAFSALYGALPPETAYYTLLNPKPASTIEDDQVKLALPGLLRHVRTMITNAAHDHVIGSDRLAQFITSELGVPGAREPRSARVEALVLRYGEGEQREIMFPRYEQSGHAVSLFEPELLANDVREFLASFD
jgi:hypothetical protein